MLKTEGNVDGLPRVVEPNLFNKNGQSFLHFARVLGTPEHGVVLVRLLNLSSAPQIIYKTSKVGRFEPVSEDMIALTQPIETSDLTENQTEKTPEKEANSSKIENTHLHEISVDFSKSNLTFDQQNQLKNLLNEFHDIFTKDEHDLGKTDIVQHKIDVGDHPPIKSTPYRVPYSQQSIISQVKSMSMIENNIIKSLASPWSSSVVLVKKKNGSQRFCTDFRKLNSITKKENYPLPRINETIDSLGNAYFSLLWISPLATGKLPWHLKILTKLLLQLFAVISSSTGCHLDSPMLLLVASS